MKHIVGIGDSHLHAVTWAMRELEAEQPELLRYTPMCLLDPPYSPSFTDENGIKIANPAWVAALQDILGGGDEVSIFLFVGGSEYFRWSLTPGPSPFDFVDPEQDDGAAPIGQIVPYDLIMTHARGMFRFMTIVIDFLRTQTSLPLLQIIAPPPIRDLHRKLRGEPVLLERIRDFGFSPLRFRAKMWRAAARALTDVCAELNVPCLPCPPEALAPEGCLRDDLIGDVVHANKAWGHIIARKLLHRAGMMLETA